MKTWVVLLGALVMICGLTGCASSEANGLMPFERRIPGKPLDNTYAPKFWVDWKTLEDGYHEYEDESGVTRRGFNATRFGYRKFQDLVLDFTFKDGRQFHEILPLRKLMASMLEKYTIHDMSKNKLYGNAFITVTLDNSFLSVSYEIQQMLSEEIRAGIKWATTYQYPIFEKDLSGFEPMPGNPDLNVCGLSFELDKNVFAAGTYSYTPEGKDTFNMENGGRYGNQRSGELSLDFTLKDGKRVRERIDVRPLLADLPRTQSIPNLAASPLGGTADIVVTVAGDALYLEYRLLERKKKTSLQDISSDDAITEGIERHAMSHHIIRDILDGPKDSYVEHRYPLFTKTLNH